MNRRELLAGISGVLPSLWLRGQSASAQGAPMVRCRPSDPEWPGAAAWDALNKEVEGRLIKIGSPLGACAGAPDSAACQELMRNLRNPFFMGDQVWGTQSSGWVDAWIAAPSVYAVAAKTTGDVVAAVNFAREHNLRLVIKGGGHSYQGTSNAPDSLLVWMRAMNEIALHDDFVPQGCGTPPQSAVSVGAGAIWLHATTR